MFGQVLKSTVSVGVSDGMNDPDRFLPKPALSFRAMLVLLWRWATSVPALGGLRERRSKDLALQCAMSVVEAICAAAAECGKFVVSIDFCKDWTCKAPRPELLTNALHFPVDAECKMDISAWRDDVFGGDLCERSAKMVWRDVAQQCEGELGTVSLVDLLQQDHLSKAEFGPFYGQVFFALATEAENILAGTSRGKLQVEGLRAEVKRSDVTDPG